MPFIATISHTQLVPVFAVILPVYEPVEFTILNIYGQMIKEKIATTNEKIEISLGFL